MYDSVKRDYENTEDTEKKYIYVVNSVSSPVFTDHEVYCYNVFTIIERSMNDYI